MIATETRQQAIARLGAIAGYDGRLDVNLILARPNAIELLYRQALRASVGDDPTLNEVRALYPVARGRTTPLVDAVYDGAPQPTPARAEAISIGDLEHAIAEVFGG